MIQCILYVRSEQWMVVIISKRILNIYMSFTLNRNKSLFLVTFSHKDDVCIITVNRAKAEMNKNVDTIDHPHSYPFFWIQAGHARQIYNLSQFSIKYSNENKAIKRDLYHSTSVITYGSCLNMHYNHCDFLFNLIFYSIWHLCFGKSLFLQS